MEDEEEDVNWFKVLPWWQKILVLLVGFGIAALFFLGPDAFGQINENKQAMLEYKKSKIFSEIGNNPSFINHIITDFEILEGPSKVTGIR